MWMDQALLELSENEIYNRDDLFKIFRNIKNDMNENSLSWALYNLELENKLFRVGYDKYAKARLDIMPSYKPAYSDEALSLMNELKENFEDLNFVIFENRLLNEFLNHQIAHNTIYIQVEKEASSFIFDFLKDRHNGSILYNPQEKELECYWDSDCIIVLDLISQSPRNKENPNEIVGEKLLVDIIADKSISSTFSSSELPYIYDNFKENYIIDLRKLNRYAGRRGKTQIVRDYIGES